MSFSDSGSYFNLLMHTVSQGQTGGVAWWAHIGGFIFGIIFLKILLALPDAEPPQTNIRRDHCTEKNTAPASYPPGRSRAGSPPLRSHYHYGRMRLSQARANWSTFPGDFTNDFSKYPFRRGIKAGSKLRLKGLGKKVGSNDRRERGNLYLKVRIQ